MALTKEQKRKIIEDLKEKIAKQKIMIFVDFTGLKVKDFLILRKKMKSTGNELKVAKKTLLGLILKKAGIETDVKKLMGEIATVFGLQDEISPAKIVYQFSLENQNLKILGGIFEKKFREAGEIITLAQLPTKEELLVRLVRNISSPISNFINVLKTNIKGLVYLLSVIKK